jgi:hypothetical protein
MATYTQGNSPACWAHALWLRTNFPGPSEYFNFDASHCARSSEYHFADQFRQPSVFRRQQAVVKESSRELRPCMQRPGTMLSMPLRSRFDSEEAMLEEAMRNLEQTSFGLTDSLNTGRTALCPVRLTSPPPHGTGMLFVTTSVGRGADHPATPQRAGSGYLRALCSVFPRKTGSSIIRSPAAKPIDLVEGQSLSHLRLHHWAQVAIHRVVSR